MKNITITPVTTWQLTLSAHGCATSAPKAVFTPLGATGAVAIDALDAIATKRERAFAGMGHRDLTVANVSGSFAWSPPI